MFFRKKPVPMDPPRSVDPGEHFMKTASNPPDSIDVARRLVQYYDRAAVEDAHRFHLKLYRRVREMAAGDQEVIDYLDSREQAMADLVAEVDSIDWDTVLEEHGN